MERKPEKIRILFTIPNFDTAGSGKALLNIATRLEKTNFEPHIACLHNRGHYFKVVEVSKIPIHIFEFTTSMTNRIKGLFQCWKISRQMKKINPHLIHSFHYAPDYSEALAACFAGIPWIYTKKNMNWGGKSKNGWKLRTFLAQHVIAQNDYMMEWFFPKSKKVTLIPRGVDTMQFSPKSKNEKLLKQYTISNTEKVIISVANLVPLKGIDVLIDAFEILFNKNSNIHLFIVGDKNNIYGKILEEKIIGLNAKDKIHLTGKIQDVIEYYSISDVFVLPSKRESCPVALMEAMACGIPVLASNIPGVQSILHLFKECFFPIGSEKILAEKLHLLIVEKNKLEENRDKLRHHIINNYSITKEVNKHDRLYSALLQKY